MKKVLLVNGSPHKEGNTALALSEIEKVLLENGVETEHFWIGTGPVRGCIGCRTCHKTRTYRCQFTDDKANDLIEAILACDGLVLGSPVYFAGPNSALCALLDRCFYAAVPFFKGRVGAALTVARRGGASTALDRLNKYLTYGQMPMATSQYWNIAYGLTPGQVAEDAEGMQTMRTLGLNMAYLVNLVDKDNYVKSERPVATNFIR